MTSRRRFLSRAGLGSAALLAACSGDEREVPPAPRPGDAEVLNGLLAVEYRLVAAYSAVRGPLRELREQEEEHVDALVQAVKEAGGTPRRAPATRPERDLLALEREAIAAYLDAVGRLSGGELRATASAIMATEAEHESLLLADAGRNPLPSPFVTGRSR
jgi:hypothetical protein